MNTPAYFCIDQVVTEDLSTSLYSRIQNDLKLDLFPNPATAFVQIKCRKATLTRIFIYDQKGNRMFSSTLVDGHFILDVQDYLPGLYYLMLDNDTKHISGIFIRQ